MKSNFNGKFGKKKNKKKETEEPNEFPQVETERSPDLVYPQLDHTTSDTFIYISNYTRRNYQYEIAISAVTANTLIIIPTSLGKTFIAALLILNFYRWFPSGKILFLAPSRPLVTQQMIKIQEVTQIPKTEIAEITGSITPEVRKAKWKTARVFFATAQTVQKDIENKVCSVDKIVLLVEDEAHKARGNHSYCVIVKEIAKISKFFRVIGLTATPGSTFADVQHVIYNLMISKIEIRNDSDCAQYIHTKDIQSEIIPNSEGTEELSARLNSILQYYLKELRKLSLISNTDPLKTTKGAMTKLLTSSNVLDKAGFAITQSIRLLNLREKLECYSVPVFVQELENFLKKEDRPDDTQFNELHCLLETAKRAPQVDPKMEKLTQIVVDFLKSSISSKIIIFCNFRKIVTDIVKKLNMASDIIKCIEFIGQSSKIGDKGQNQAKQLSIMEAFNKGIYNTLVSTSIGEEGLDIGEVDLIICYDAQKSPIRTIQRMGRTGRHQDGKVIFLLTESTKNLLKTAETAQNSISTLVARRRNDFEFYKSEKMNPSQFEIKYKNIEIKNDNIDDNCKKEIKRATLLNKEIEELQQRHGEYLVYGPLSLSNFLHYQTSSRKYNITNSNESKLLSDLLNLNAEYEAKSSEQVKVPYSFETNESSDTIQSPINSSSIPDIASLKSNDSIDLNQYEEMFSNNANLTKYQQITNILLNDSSSSKSSQNIDINNERPINIICSNNTLLSSKNDLSVNNEQQTKKDVNNQNRLQKIIEMDDLYSESSDINVFNNILKKQNNSSYLNESSDDNFPVQHYIPDSEDYSFESESSIISESSDIIENINTSPFLKSTSSDIFFE